MTENFGLSIMAGLTFGISYLFIMLISWLFFNVKRSAIIKYLTEIGATHITVRWRMFRSDWYHTAYDVTYRDAVGRVHETICTVRSFLWMAPSLLWDDQPQIASKQDDGMEMLMSDLMAENAQLRVKLQAAILDQ